MPILINKTFSRTTPESAEEGEFSETGFEWENAEVTFHELVELMESHYNPSCYPADGGIYEWYSTNFEVIDYQEMIEEETSIHYSSDNPPRKAKYWKLAAQCAGIVKTK